MLPTLLLPLLLAPAQAAPSAAPADPRDLSTRFPLRTEEVAPGILAFIGEGRSQDILSGNSVAILGSTGVAVVDSGQFPSQARAMIAAIRARTSQPVRFLITTHWHGDHHYGHAAYREAFPGLVIVGTPSTQAMMRAMAPRYFGMAYFGPASKQVEAALADPGLEAGLRTRFTALMGDFQAARPDLEQFRLTPPTLAYDGRIALDLGDRTVEVLHLGRGATAGDSVVLVPDAKVLATGDLVVHPVPHGFGSFPQEWAAVLGKLEAMGPRILVPGHGPVQRDLAYLRLVREALEAIDAQMRAAVERGLGQAEALKALELAAFRKAFAGEDPARQRDFDGRFARAAAVRAWRLAKEGRVVDED
jgi:glyoxylase-like metal-dependent hydrolase (beta-lactamase superfamily II)